MARDEGRRSVTEAEAVSVNDMHQVDLLAEEEIRTPWTIKSVTARAKRCTCYDVSS